MADGRSNIVIVKNARVPMSEARRTLSVRRARDERENANRGGSSSSSSIKHEMKTMMTPCTLLLLLLSSLLLLLTSSSTTTPEFTLASSSHAHEDDLDHDENARRLPTCPASNADEYHHHPHGGLNVYRNHSSSAFHHAIRLELQYADNRIDERLAGNVAVRDHVNAFALQGTVLNGRYRVEERLPSVSTALLLEGVGLKELPFVTEERSPVEAIADAGEEGEDAFHEEVLRERYGLGRSFERGSSGEVFYARDINSGAAKRYVLKRILANQSEAGRREVHFGEKLKNHSMHFIVRYVESFQRVVPLVADDDDDDATKKQEEEETWLVFEDEGKSLKSLLYESTRAGLVRPSRFWARMRQEGGALIRREIARHLVQALHLLGSLGVWAHRDVKPANVLINHENDSPVRIGDFGSAVDAETVSDPRYYSVPPGPREETRNYAPPPLRNSDPPVPRHLNFDQWSLGVTLLEMLLGTDKVFQLSEQGRRGRKRKRRGSTTAATGEELDAEDELAQFGLDEGELSKFNRSVREADVFRRGFFDDPLLGELELDFVHRLLCRDPRKRLSLAEALEHPYISGNVGASKRDAGELVGTPDGDVVDQNELVAIARFEVVDCDSSEPRKAERRRVYGSYTACEMAMKAIQTREERRKRNETGSESESSSTTTTPRRCALVRDDAALQTYFVARPRVCSEYPHLSVPSSHLGSSFARNDDDDHHEDATGDDDSTRRPIVVTHCMNRGAKSVSEDFLIEFETPPDHPRLSALIVLADSHQGETAGRYAARRLAELLVEMRKDHADDAQVKRAFAQIDEELKMAHHGEGGAAVTAVEMLRDGSLRVSNAGDVKTVLLGRTTSGEFNERPTCLTEDHVVGRNLTERKRIEKGGGVVSGGRVGGRLILSRSLGDAGFEPWVSNEPAITHVSPTQARGALLVVATDGMWDAMGEGEAASVAGWAGRIRTGARGAARNLVLETMARGLSNDNIGVVVIEFSI